MKNENANKPLTGTRVQQVNGASCLVMDFADGSEVMADIQFNTYSYHPDDPASHRLIEDMARHGTRVFGFMMCMADRIWTEPVWRYENGEGSLDFSGIAARIEMTRKYCPEARFIVRLFAGAPPEFLQRHPQERAVMMLPDGSLTHRYEHTMIADPGRDYVSIASPVWRAQMGEALQKTVAYMEAHYGESILAYCISGLSSEEWYHHGWHNKALDDYSEPMRRAFTAFLRQKYEGDAARFAAAWARPGVAGFADAAVPPYERRISAEKSTFYNPETEQDVIDFNLFYNFIIPDTIRALCAAAKRGAPSKVVGTLYGYQLEFGECYAGHAGLGHLLDMPEVDYVMVEAGYKRRHAATGGDNPRSPFTSYGLHGKLLVNDNDTVTCRFEDIYPEDERKAFYRDWLGYAPTPWLSGEIQKRVLGFAACNQMTTTFFDLHGGYYLDETIHEKMSQGESVYTQSFAKQRQSAAQVLVLVDEKSESYVRVHSVWPNNAFYQEQTDALIIELIKLGAPYDVVHLRDLPGLPLERYKLVVVFNAYVVTPAEKQALERLQGGGRTVVWGYAPGYFQNGAGSLQNAAALCGFALRQGNWRRGSFLSEDSARYTLPELPEFEGDNTPEFTEITAADEDAEPLFEDLGRVAVQKRFKNHTGVYTQSVCFTARHWRALARQAGVTIYSDKPDTVYANNVLVVVHANGGGLRTVTLPRPAARVVNAVSGQVVATQAASFPLELANGETAMLWLE